uniref:Uncharacterized protein n=1 Tax=Cannabis sativa TaxID=3483 RepID=A0A803Q7U8_CANSA
MVFTLKFDLMMWTPLLTRGKKENNFGALPPEIRVVNLSIGNCAGTLVNIQGHPGDHLGNSRVRHVKLPKRRIVRGHRLDYYVIGTRVKPPKFVPSVVNRDGDEKIGFGVQFTSVFEQWIVHEQLPMGWLYGSITEEIVTGVMGSETFATLWSALEALYGAYSKEKRM